MKVSVIIPTIGRPELAALLQSLREQTRPPDEIIVERDGAAPRRGPAATRNAGARRAHGDIFLFIDDDCVAAPEWVARMSASFENPVVSAASGSLIYRKENYEPARGERAVHNFHGRWFMGANCGVRRDAFWKLGGFPEKYCAYEDKAFSLACAMKKYVVARVSDARVYHGASMWDNALTKKLEKNLSWWIDLLRDYDVWADTHNPPPILFRRIIMPRDFFSILKNLFHAYNPAARLRLKLLMRQRFFLWRAAVRKKMFVI